MTVKELIEELQKFPQDFKVVLGDDYGWYGVTEFDIDVIATNDKKIYTQEMVKNKGIFEMVVGLVRC